MLILFPLLFSSSDVRQQLKRKKWKVFVRIKHITYKRSSWTRIIWKPSLQLRLKKIIKKWKKWLLSAKRTIHRPRRFNSWIQNWSYSLSCVNKTIIIFQVNAQSCSNSFLLICVNFVRSKRGQLNIQSERKKKFGPKFKNNIRCEKKNKKKNI